MAITTASIAVTTTAIQLAAISGVTSAAVGTTGHNTVTVVNTGAGTVYLGPVTVTASGVTQGLPLAAGAAFSLDLVADDVLYGISASGSNTVNVLVAAQK